MSESAESERHAAAAAPRKFRALDLFAGAGGAAMGLHRAGFEVTGIDNRPQPRYPFRFIQGDALAPPVRLEDFDLIWASPPCQAHTPVRKMWNARKHPNLIPATRAMLEAAGVLYVMENVPGSPLRVDLQLCGTMFNLGTEGGGAQLRRHRWFEANFPMLATPCRHDAEVVIGVYGGHGRDRRRKASVGVYGHAGGRSAREKAQRFPTADRRQAMGIEWMTNDELSQAIPPAYSQWIGTYAMLALGAR